MKYTEILKKNDDFRSVYSLKNSVAGRYLVLYVKKNCLDINRLGISVSKKVGNSVVRHMIRRLVKEAYRLNEEKFHKGFDLVFIARVNSKDCTYFEIESAICRLAEKKKIIKEE